MNEEHVDAVAEALWVFDKQPWVWERASAAMRGYYRAKARVAVRAMKKANTDRSERAWDGAESAGVTAA